MTAQRHPPHVTGRLADRDYRPSGFFVLRTPLLPYRELLEWSEGLSAASVGDSLPELKPAVAADRKRLRERARNLWARPEVSEAIFLGSPDLESRLSEGLPPPESDAGSRLELAFARYFFRMAGRPTPFGLFGGISVGRVGDRTRLAIESRTSYERCSRLDMDYLSRLVSALERDPAVRKQLRFHPNTSLYEASGRLRYAESRIEGKGRTHHLVAVDLNEYLARALSLSRDGRLPSETASGLIEHDPTIDAGAALAFVDELIDTQILVSELEIPLTAEDGLERLCERLQRIPSVADVVGRLRAAQAGLREFDRRRLGTPPQAYRDFAQRLANLPVDVELKALIQVDMFKPAPIAELGREPLLEMLRGLDMLYRLGRRPPETPLSRFADAFRERYGSATVPLVEALDEEIGVGFDRSEAPSAEGSPLLAGLPIPAPQREDSAPRSRLDAMLLRKYAQSLAAGGAPVEITEQDLGALDDEQRSLPPDCFSVTAILGAASLADLDAGRFEVQIRGAMGPSGVGSIGRFCHLSPELRSNVVAHLRAEEAHRPQAVFAEIVHLPQGRIGNILQRPALRDHEIPFLGCAGVPASHRIPVTDLTLQIIDDRIVLRSRRLGQEVIPRLTTAHNFSGPNLGLYRFLCHLQFQEGLGLQWSWGALEAAPFLPRVVSGRIVFALARWTMNADAIKSLSRLQGAEAFAGLQTWRRMQRPPAPRWVELVEADNTLPLDLENILAVDVLLHRLRGRPVAILSEIHPDADHLVAHGPEGSFRHELVIPFERLRDESMAPERVSPDIGSVESRSALAPDRSTPTGKESRRFLPGSEWLYAKLYCGTSEADHILREVVRPVVNEALRTGAARRWFFIRFGDPDWHLRLRFSGESTRLVAELLPLLHDRAEGLSREGRLWRLEFDTYDRELERYGGPSAIEATEEYFQADSEAVLDIVSQLSGDAGADLRWRFAVYGIDRLMDDFGLDLVARQRIMRDMHEDLWRELRGGKALRMELGRRFRDKRQSLMELLGPVRRESECFVHEALDRRRDRVRGPVARLK